MSLEFSDKRLSYFDDKVYFSDDNSVTWSFSHFFKVFSGFYAFS
jgi:hypothetical protein